jgi:hypothetical protein
MTVLPPVISLVAENLRRRSRTALSTSGLDPTDEFCRPRWSVQVPAPAVDASVAYGQAKSDIRPCAKEEKEDV